MTDNEEQKPRPNANYKLSKNSVNPEDEAKLTFYYNRERRLEKSPQIVKDLYKEEKKQHRFNLLQPLVADKPRAMLFFTIVVLSVIILLLSVFGQFDKIVTLSGNKLDIKGTAFEGTTIILIKKTAKNSSAYTGVVDIAVSVLAAEGEQYPVFLQRVSFTSETEETYRFAAPFNSPELLMVLQNEKSTATFKLKPE